jgi:Polyketide cyclase / dehydrase and lipid transport
VWKWVLVVICALLAVVGLIALLGAQLPVQHVAARTVEFQQTPQQVWDVIAGPPTGRPEVARYEVLTPDPHRKWIEYGRHGEKMTFELVESDPPRKLVTRIADPHLPFGGTWTYEIAPLANGSSLTITEHGEIYNPVFRLIARYVQGYSATIDNYLKALRAKLQTA